MPAHLICLASDATAGALKIPLWSRPFCSADAALQWLISAAPPPPFVVLLLRIFQSLPAAIPFSTLSGSRASVCVCLLVGCDGQSSCCQASEMRSCDFPVTVTGKKDQRSVINYFLKCHRSLIHDKNVLIILFFTPSGMWFRVFREKHLVGVIYFKMWLTSMFVGILISKFNSKSRFFCFYLTLMWHVFF